MKKNRKKALKIKIEKKKCEGGNEGRIEEKV